MLDSLHLASKVSEHLFINLSFDFILLLFNESFNILNTNSIGAKSGEYSGRYNRYIFKILAMNLTKSVLCALTLSKNTTIRGNFAQIFDNLYNFNKL